MTNKNLIMAFDIINETGEGWFKGAVSEQILIKAEQYLGLKFPPSYKEFLLEKGNGHFKGLEIYGLVSEDFSKGPIPDSIWLTMEERKINGLNKSLILICQSLEYYYAIDTGQTIDGENPVVDIIPGVPNEKLEIIALDFGVFFLNEIRALCGT